MAEPVSFPEANITIAPPACGPEDLVSCSLVGNGSRGELVSCWKFSFQELAEILRNGGVVWVMVRGQVQPDMMVTGHKAAVL